MATVSCVVATKLTRGLRDCCDFGASFALPNLVAAFPQSCLFRRGAKQLELESQRRSTSKETEPRTKSTGEAEEMGFKTFGISQTTRFKRRLSTSGRPGSDKRSHGPSPSPTAAPFNSTSFLIRQNSQHREEAPEQYGSNVENMIACCSFALDNHDRDCGYQSQAQHPIIVGMSNHDSSLLHLQLQRLQITDCLDTTQILNAHQQQHAGFHSEYHSGYQPDTDSGAALRMELDYSSSAARDREDRAMFEHRRVRSVMDDNFDLLQSNASASNVRVS